MELVADVEEVARIAGAIASAPLVAFDLEFLSQDRLVPVLCLVQVAWLPVHVTLDAPEATIVASIPEVAIIDPLAVDVGPIVRALAAHVCTVAHAPRQDLGLLATRFGVAMPAIIDTQLMAAFAGIGDQVGLATLAGELVGVTIGKELQWTDWAARPLSAAHLAYADADVRHLPAIYAKLAARLGPRLAWARAESSLVAADAVAAAAVTPESAWQQLGGIRGLDATAQGAVIELAAWRQRVAVELDRPLGQVLADRLLLELARHRPTTAAAVRGIKGMSSIARQRADELVVAIAAGRPDRASPSTPRRSASARAQRWVEILLSIVQLVAEQAGVAARLLATRADAEEFARTVDERGLAGAAALPALATWRRDVLGPAWTGWLTGALALIGDPTAGQGIALQRVNGDGKDP